MFFLLARRHKWDIVRMAMRNGTRHGIQDTPGVMVFKPFFGGSCTKGWSLSRDGPIAGGVQLHRGLEKSPPRSIF
jgi:hypothetical protein